MERRYLLVTEKLLIWTFRVWEIRSFFHPKSWWTDDIYVVFLSFLWNSRIREIWFFARCTIPMGRVIALLLFVRNIWVIVVRSELRSCETSKMVLFCENTLQFKVVNNFGKKLHFKVFYGVLALPLVCFFFRFTFIIDLFCFPNIFEH